MSGAGATGRSAVPDPRIRFHLFYGPDDSGSRALARRVVEAWAAEREMLSGGDLKDDPGALVAAANSPSLFGAPPLSWVEPIGEESFDAVARLLDSDSPRPAIGIAGALKKTSKLLKLVEGHPAGSAVISYALDGGKLEAHVAAEARVRGLVVDRALAREIGEACAGNRALIGNELDKYALYLAADPAVPVDLEPEVVARLGAEVADKDFFELADMAVGGQVAALAGALQDGRAGGSEIPLVRAVQRRLLQVASVRGRIDGGQPLSSAMRGVVFGRDERLVGDAVGRWRSEQVAAAIDRLSALEKEIMLRGAPAEAATGETLATFARVAAKGRR